jgi:hypothetical protein
VRGRKSKGRRGGSDDLSSGRRRAARHVKRKKIGGSGSGVRCERGGVSSGKTQGRRVWAAAGERRRARRGARRQRGKSGRERGGWRVGQHAGWAPSISETRRAGERLVGGPDRNLI